MCYSARVQADYGVYRRLYGADIDLQRFVSLYVAPLRTPRALDLAVLSSADPADAPLIAAARAANDAAIARLEQEVAAQSARLARAQAVIAGPRPTKKAANEAGIAERKLAAARQRLGGLRLRTAGPGDDRIFPGYHVPVLVADGGHRIVRPMRYQCRPAGKPADFDRRFPGTYNARRDNLEGFWREQFGRDHGVVLLDAFFEHVERDGRHQVLEFRPDDGQPLLAACLWSRWTGEGEDLLSFALVTDEPPPEVAAAGHDRCIVPIRPENLDAWLNPDPADLATQRAILDDPVRPCYRHRLAEAA